MLQFPVLHPLSLQRPELVSGDKGIPDLLHLKGFHLRSRVKRRAHNAEIDLSLVQRLDRLRRRRIGDHDLDIRISLVEGLQVRKQVELQRHIARADPHLSHVHIHEAL